MLRPKAFLSALPRLTFGPLLLGGLLSCSGCEKNGPLEEAAAPERSARGASNSTEEGTDSEEAPAPVASEELPPGEPQEKELPPPKFSDAASPEFRQAFQDLRTFAQKHGGRVHAALVDLEDDEWLLKNDELKPVNVASNAKVLTAAAALELLGPAYRYPTELLGSIDSEGRVPRLVLRGGGAPDLTTADLWRLLRVATGRGMKSVAEVAVDQSRFSDVYVPPAFEQQPEEWAPFRAPIAALSLNENAVSLNVVATESGKDALVFYDPPLVVAPQGAVKTGGKGRGDRVSWRLDIKDAAQRPKSIVGGSLAQGLGRRRYARRLEDPRLAGGWALTSLLKDSGVALEKDPVLAVKKKEPRLALWYSEPVAELLRSLGKDSNNFYAEMIFASLCKKRETKEKAIPWSSECGAQAVMEWIGERGLPSEGIVVKNGSGLFDANRLSAEFLVKVLAAMEDNPRVFQDFVSQLAMGATDGTLKRRMRGEIGPRVRAKTGTLRNVNALSGYIQRPGGRSPAAFSLVVVGVSGRHGEVRAKMDSTVLAWASALEKRPEK